MSGLVPELICSDLEVSLEFYGRLGFRVLYGRPQERFAYLDREGAALMLEQPLTRDRLFPRAELTYPFGRGLDLTMDVDNVDEVCATVLAAGHELLLPLEERWYQRAGDAICVRQFVVQDPDGYLIRISEDLRTAVNEAVVHRPGNGPPG